MNTLARGLLILTLAVGVLGFGVIGLCGGFVSATAVWPALFTPGAAGSLVFLALSLPCLIGGFFMVNVCMGKIRQLLRQPHSEEDAS